MKASIIEKVLTNRKSKKGKTMATTKEDRAKAIKDFQARKQAAGEAKKIPQDKGGGIEHGEQAAKATEAPQQEVVETPVDPTILPFIKSTMGGLTCYTVVMSMLDIFNYTEYAKELYEVEEGEKSPDPSKTWQRTLNTTRASKEIAPYLHQDLHFFPPIVCVVASDGVSIDEEAGTITIDASGLAVLDGQHRRAGIEFVINQVGPDSDFAKETIPVVVLGSDIDIDARQQIFADINRSAKVVSKALNILFDHRDQYATIAQAIAQELQDNGGDCMVDLTRTVPTAKSNHVASLSNLYNLVVNFASSNPKRHGSAMREGMDPQAIRDLALTVVSSFPSFERMKNGTDTYQGVRGAYICYTSTLYQGIGLALKHKLMGKPADQWNEAAKVLVSTTKWDNSNPMWQKEGKEIIVGGKVGTRSEHVTRAAAELELAWANVALPEATE